MCPFGVLGLSCETSAAWSLFQSKEREGAGRPVDASFARSVMTTALTDNSPGRQLEAEVRERFLDVGFEAQSWEDLQRGAQPCFTRLPQSPNMHI